MKNRISLFLALSIVLTFGAAYGEESNSHLGFYKVTDASIPESVRKVAASVYQISVPGGMLVPVKEVFPGRPIQEILEGLSKMNTFAPPFSRGDRDVLLFQVQACSKVADSLSCKMYSSVGHGAGYLVGDGSVIQTAFHLVKDWAKNNVRAEQKGLLTTNSLLAFIYDSNEHLIYSPVKDSAAVQFPKSNYQAAELRRNPLPNDDLAQILLNKIVGVPLQPTKTSARVGQPVYLLGFPQKTGDRKQFDAPDSIGNTLMVSKGFIISHRVAFSKVGGSWENIGKEFQQMEEEKSIAIDADATPGMSGGAVVNTAGEVIGTLTYSNPAEEASLDHVSKISNIKH